MQAFSRSSYCWYDRNAQHVGKAFIIKLISAFFQFVVHVQGDDHGYVHVEELHGKIQVALQVRGVDNVYYYVRCLFYELPPYIDFFRAVSR